MTTETRPAELARAHHAGVNAVLIKPSTPDIVIAEMQRLVRQMQPARAPRPELPAPGVHRKTLVKAHHRHSTTTPSQPPLDLTCPVCGKPLRYEETFIGGVSARHPERWDYYECTRCGRFQYRHRTRRLRLLA